MPPSEKSAAYKGLKKSSPIIDRMNEPIITITRGLRSSDKKCDDVPLSKIESYLIKNVNCYERTLPTERNPSLLNRAYIDLDGYAGNMSESDFDELCDTIKSKLGFGLDHCVALMEASQYGHHNKDGLRNKLSFRINFIKKHGSKNAIKSFVLTDIMPVIKGLLDEVIPVVVGNDNAKGLSQYLSIDTGVYDPNGRKMRLWNSNKDNECRPNKLVGDASIIDTLITYIPDDSEALIEPMEEVPVPKAKKVRLPDKSQTTSNPAPLEESDEASEKVELIRKVLMSRNPKRCETYEGWIRTGMILFNEKLPLELWDTWSKQSKKYKAGECAVKWRTLTQGQLSQATLWRELKEDNPLVFSEMCQTRNDFWELLCSRNHADTARYFYNMKPDAYLFNENLGWFQLLKSSVWKRYDKKAPSGLTLDINETMKKVIKENWALIDITQTDDKTKAKIKGCSGFSCDVGNKTFVDGICSFLPSIYNDDELEKKMDESRHLFAFADKVIDLEKDVVRDITPSDYVSLHTGYKFPTVPRPSVRKELMDVFMSIWEDKEVVDYVLRVIASNLHGRKKYEEFYVWTGKGGNGKGLISELIKRAYGDYWHPIPSDCLTKQNDKRDAPNPPIANAKSKRFVQAQEPEGETRLQVGFIKELTGGDEITARALYANPVKFVPQFGLFLQCNTVPKLSAIDGGIKRRMVIITFPFQFVKDPIEPHHRPINIELKDKICKSDEWRDEFMLLLIDTYKAIGASLEPPAFITNATNEYMKENDAIRGWLSEYYTVVKNTTDKKYKLPQKELLEHLHETNPLLKLTIGDRQFKRLMELNGLEHLSISSPFTAPVWNEFSGTYENQIRKAGTYYGYLEKNK